MFISSGNTFLYAYAVYTYTLTSYLQEFQTYNRYIKVLVNYKNTFDLGDIKKRTLSKALGVPGSAALIFPYAGANLELIQECMNTY